MKRTLLSLIVASSLLFSCGTTTSTTTASTDATQSGSFQTSSALQTQFSTQYPNATNVTWNRYDAATVPNDWELVGWTTLTPNDYTATFDMDGNRYYSYYDANGNWIGTTYAMTNNTGLPAAFNTMMQSKYNGYTIESVNREMWRDQNAYEVKLKNGDNKVKLLVDANGNVLKEKTK